MKARHRVITLLGFAIAASAALPSPATAQPPPSDSAPAAETPAAPPPPRPAAPPVPTTAVAALDRANAAYEYGDMNQVVESARPIVDGGVEATLAERLQALRLLGIGLYLTGRPAGAEAAFLELLRNHPKARLDPTTTRPEVVAAFEDVRRRHRASIEDAARARSRKSLIWNFLPPIGQFKNGDSGRGWALLGIEVVSGAAAITTKVLLESWELPNHQSKHPDASKALKPWNYISTGVLAASYVFGVVDAFVRSDRDPEERERPLSLFLFPGGAGLSATF